MSADVPLYGPFTSIAAMPNGWTWIKPESIGTTAEECDAIAKNNVAAERILEIQKKSAAVSRALSVRESPSTRIN